MCGERLGWPIRARLGRELAAGQVEAIHGGQGGAAGDPPAVFLVERAVKAFASAMASVVDVFDPDRVVVGGGITMAWGERLLGPARAAVTATSFRLQARRVRIVPAELGDDVGLIGTVPLVASALPGWRPGGHAAMQDIPATVPGARSA